MRTGKLSLCMPVDIYHLLLRFSTTISSLGTIHFQELLLFLILCSSMGLLLPGIAAMGRRANHPRRAVSVLVPSYTAALALCELVMRAAKLPIYSELFVVLTSGGFLVVVW